MDTSLNQTSVATYASGIELGIAAAEVAARFIRDAVNTRGSARILVATGNSQLETIRALTSDSSIPWGGVDIFHLDEYVGISENHPASFRRWIRTRVEDVVHPRTATYIKGDAVDLDGEMQRYADLLAEQPIDLAFVGFGENGHIAFNDPPVADFDDPLMVKRVVLDEACRQQQAGEGHFPTAADVPREAVTVTCFGLFRAAVWICAVPDRRKAMAVRAALDGPVSETCPASLVQRHPCAFVFLDLESASLLSRL